TGWSRERFRSIFHRNVYLLYQPFRLGTVEIDREQPVFELRSRHPHAVGKHEAALELPGRDAAMQIFPLRLVGLAAAHHELVFLDADVEIVLRETRHRQDDAQPLSRAVAAAKTLDVVGRIGIAGFRQALQRLFHGVEPKQKRARKRRHSTHATVSSTSDIWGKTRMAFFPLLL